MVKPHTES